MVLVTVVTGRYLAPRVRAGALAPGTAAIRLLIALIVTPPTAALIVFAIARAAALPDAVATLPLATYAAYSVGLVCFIVTNRRMRRSTQ
jgi:hypothetical protein